jgi:hypothetical protein
MIAEQNLKLINAAQTNPALLKTLIEAGIIQE